MLKGSLLTLFFSLTITTTCLGLKAVRSASAGPPGQPVIGVIDDGAPLTPLAKSSNVHNVTRQNPPLLMAPHYESY
jgi:hypothetical protein